MPRGSLHASAAVPPAARASPGLTPATFPFSTQAGRSKLEGATPTASLGVGRGGALTPRWGSRGALMAGASAAQAPPQDTLGTAAQSPAPQGGFKLNITEKFTKVASDCGKKNNPI